MGQTIGIVNYTELKLHSIGTGLLWWVGFVWVHNFGNVRLWRVWLYVWVETPLGL